MVKGSITFILLIALTVSIKDTLAACACDAACVDANPYDREVCTGDETEGEPNVCNSYCECASAGVGNLLPCPYFLRFDPATKSCIWKNDVETCGGGTTAPAGDECEPTLCTEAGTVYNPMISACVPEGTYPCGEDIPKCVTDSIYEGKYVADKTNCSGYYYCKGNVRLKGTCDASKFHFSPQTQECVYKASLECTDAGSEPSSGTDWAKICDGAVSTFIPDPRVCNAYIYCNAQGEPRQAFCPEGKYFSNGVCASTPPASCTCEVYEWDPEVTDEEIKYAGASDPSKFYICSQGGRSEEECFPNTIWSQEYESCVYP